MWAAYGISMRQSLWFQVTYLVVVVAVSMACDSADQRNTESPRESFDISRAVQAAVQATREAEIDVRATMEPTVGPRVTSTGSSPRPEPTAPLEAGRR